MLQQPSPRKWQGCPGYISWPKTVPLTQPSQQAVQVPHCRLPCATAGLLLPARHGVLVTLVLCPPLIGLRHIFFHVSIHDAVGSIGGAAERAKNFSSFSLGASVATFIGPSLSGFLIDALGFRPTFVALAGISVVVVLLALAFPRMVPPRGEAHDERRKRRALDLLKDAPLRRTL